MSAMSAPLALSESPYLRLVVLTAVSFADSLGGAFMHIGMVPFLLATKAGMKYLFPYQGWIAARALNRVNSRN